MIICKHIAELVLVYFVDEMLHVIIAEKYKNKCHCVGVHVKISLHFYLNQTQ